MDRIKVLHIITGLDVGGAENMLYKLLSCMERDNFSAEVVSLTDIGPVGEKIQALGVPVRAMGMKRGVPKPLAVWRLSRSLRKSRPDLIQTWMYHADLLGGIAARLVGGFPVVWGVHHSNLALQANKRTTIWTAMACARLSRYLPIRIVCCAEASRRLHAELGYAAEKLQVIHNGFDLAAFQPDESARLSVRRELGISDTALLTGLVGRFDRQKDHGNFVQTAAIVSARFPEAQFLLCGQGVVRENAELAGWIEAAGIGSRCHLLGQRDDVPRLLAALDIAVSSSLGEAFPLAVGEAMACAVPCAVTDVGDSALLVGDTGRVAMSANPEALAKACGELLEMSAESRSLLGAAARRRIQENFDLLHTASMYDKLYREVLALKGGRAAQEGGKGSGG
ncbi:MAG: glycosyltransferase [Firmicutes bacterium]|nr:glycosyltransferase [Bacillota bacterium]MCL5992575.1 glycosyltransferase [Bacillota bacterium]